jgi:glutathione gamma-glutamylcysteinyltransferase
MSPPKALAPPGLSRTFYKRELFPPAVAFSSEEGQLIFRNALAAGTMQGFFRLIEQFRTQDEPAYCGLASVAMVLNSLAIDPRRAWKGPWRYFHEQMLDCCLPLEKVRQEGITLEQAACLARCNGAAVEVFPYGAVSIETFREMVKAASANPENHLVVSYTRKAFNQTGDGHFSPIGGYSPEKDMVLILDTARFKYPPHWLNLEDLYHAMEACDSVTGLPRGFMRLGLPVVLDSVLFTLDVRDIHWVKAFTYAENGIAAKAAGAAAEVKGATRESVIAAAVRAAPCEAVKKFLAVRMAGNSCNGGVCTQNAAIETFLNELRVLPLYSVITKALAVSTTAAATSSDDHEEREDQEKNSETKDDNDQSRDEEDEEYHNGVLSKNASKISSAKPAVPGALLAERLTMLLLLAPARSWENSITSETLRNEVHKLLDLSSHKVVDCELQYLKEQYNELPAVRRIMACGSIDCSEQGHQQCLTSISLLMQEEEEEEEEEEEVGTQQKKSQAAM